MKSYERRKVLQTATKAALVGGLVTMKYFKRLKQVSSKKGAGLVSEADRESEAIIKDIVLSRFPHHQFLGEEGGMTSGASQYLWHVDPLDGTTNYIHGFPFFCVSIGVEVNGELEVGVVHAPLLKQTFVASRGGGAFLNGKSISVSQASKIEDSLLATGFSYSGRKLIKSEMRDFENLSQSARGIRRAGSAALDFCMVACGVFDGFWERGLSSWDTAAGTLLVREAGGLVTDFKGKAFDLKQSSVVAANPKVHKALLKRLKSK